MKKSKREAKLARRAEKMERWERLIADLDHVKTENARLSSKFERLNGAVSDHINVSYPKMLENISSILNEEPDTSKEVSDEEDNEVSEEEIEKIVENWDHEELVRVFWLFVNDQGIEDDFMDYARNVARNEL